jgi:hypothetical protein
MEKPGYTPRKHEGELPTVVDASQVVDRSEGSRLPWLEGRDGEYSPLPEERRGFRIPNGLVRNWHIPDEEY